MVTRDSEFVISKFTHTMNKIKDGFSNYNSNNPKIRYKLFFMFWKFQINSTIRCYSSNYKLSSYSGKWTNCILLPYFTVSLSFFRCSVLFLQNRIFKEIFHDHLWNDFASNGFAWNQTVKLVLWVLSNFQTTTGFNYFLRKKTTLEMCMQSSKYTFSLLTTASTD